MKKSGILHVQLAGYIAGLGHKDLFILGDAGLPIPKGVPVVDLALCGGVPTFQQVLDALLQEAVVEFYTMAEEAGRCGFPGIGGSYEAIEFWVAELRLCVFRRPHCGPGRNRPLVRDEYLLRR